MLHYLPRLRLSWNKQWLNIILGEWQLIILCNDTDCVTLDLLGASLKLATMLCNATVTNGTIFLSKYLQIAENGGMYDLYEYTGHSLYIIIDWRRHAFCNFIWQCFESATLVVLIILLFWSFTDIGRVFCQLSLRSNTLTYRSRCFKMLRYLKMKHLIWYQNNTPRVPRSNR